MKNPMSSGDETGTTSRTRRVCQTEGNGSEIRCNTLTPFLKKGTWSSPTYPRFISYPVRFLNHDFHFPTSIPVCLPYANAPLSPSRYSADAMASNNHPVSRKKDRIEGLGAPRRSRSMRCSMVDISVAEGPINRRLELGAMYSFDHLSARCLGWAV